MSKLIPQSFIDDLLAKIDIVDIIGSRVKLKRTGSNYVGLCPFHTEKTPSFSVSSTKQFFHCFGCNAHGSAIGFIMDFEHLSFIEAVENLASQAGLEVPKTKETNNKFNYTELYELTKKTAYFYKKQLTKSTRAINYLKSRGLTGEICKVFQVGYSPSDWKHLEALHGSSINLKKQLTTAGVLTAKDTKFYPRFRDRIMFPIRNIKGQIIGFGGRTLGDDLAKYLNSPETPIFHKGEELYGIYEAKKANNHPNHMVVVEGYLDVIALAQFGITNVVATLGTAISTKQIQLLLRHTSEIIFCFDGDRAGRGAAWRALENSLPLMRDGIQIKFLFLPEKQDPDSLIRKESKEKFIQLINEAMPLSDFFIKHLLEGININTIDGKAKLTKIGKELLKKMPRGIFYQLLTTKIANLANINVEELITQDSTNNERTSLNPQKILSETTNQEPHLAIQNILHILIHHPNLISAVDNPDGLEKIKLEGIDLLSNLLTLLKKQPNLSTGAILEYWRDNPHIELLNKLACKPLVIPHDALKNELIGIIQLLEKLEQEVIIQQLLTKATIEELNIEEKQKLQNLITILKK